MIGEERSPVGGELPRSALLTLGQTGSFKAIVSPSNAVLVDGLAPTRKELCALVLGQVNRVSESGVDLGSSHALRLAA